LAALAEVLLLLPLLADILGVFFSEEFLSLSEGFPCAFYPNNTGFSKVFAGYFPYLVVAELG